MRAMTASVLIRFSTADGEEREERWPSVATFCAWALTQSGRCRYTAYQEDEDGDWPVIARGVVAGESD